jgi:HEAT repeat protein
MRSYLGSIVIILALTVAGVAQDQSSSSPPDVPLLLKRLEDRDSRVVFAAAAQLTKLGSSIAPALIEALRDRHGCRLQWVASGILFRLEIERRLVNATLLDIAKGKCEGTSRDDLILRREAALALIGKVDGILMIAEMLTDNDLFVQRSAAFAFDDLTERLEGRSPQVEATTEILEATKRAFPLLLQAALRDRDEVVRCMSYESLDQARRSKHEPLRTEATRLLDGKAIPCSR